MENVQCQKIREAMSAEFSSSQEIKTSSEVDRHLRDCNDCRTWAEQSHQIISYANDIPQFDVPEAVTQRILQAVASETTRPFLSGDYALWISAAIVALLAIFVLSDTVENLEGLASWSLGLGLIAIVRMASLRLPFHKAVQQ
jgi:predicted anti-sigma-YlaC factor YlaD